MVYKAPKEPKFENEDELVFWLTGQVQTASFEAIDRANAAEREAVGAREAASYAHNCNERVRYILARRLNEAGR